jgi:tRNA(Arg) A34 adenosine deaminase TadA
MCQAAILWAGIPEVVYGTSVEKLVELGWNQFDLRATTVIASAPFAQCKITGGILAEECDQLFKQGRV